jgi:hypothetical protein
MGVHCGIRVSKPQFRCCDRAGAAESLFELGYYHALGAWELWRKKERERESARVANKLFGYFDLWYTGLS